jgi:hypothetical protein
MFRYEMQSSIQRRLNNSEPIANAHIQNLSETIYSDGIQTHSIIQDFPRAARRAAAVADTNESTSAIKLTSITHLLKESVRQSTDPRGVHSLQTPRGNSEVPNRNSFSRIPIVLDIAV